MKRKITKNKALEEKSHRQFYGSQKIYLTEI